MVVNGRASPHSTVADTTGPLPPAVIWHDLECGSYSADLPLWRQLARDAPAGAVLDVGAGTGRVALELARAGAQVIALDHDSTLLDTLRERAGSLDIQTLCADARSFALSESTPQAGTTRSEGQSRVALCVAPMQTVQLLGGAEGRRAFLRRARAHLLPGGLLACAIVTELEPFDCTDGGPGPSPERARVEGVLYTSQATRVELGPQRIEIERERTTSASKTVERNLIELDRLTVAQLEREGAAAGLHPEQAHHIPTTAEHSGSQVVMLRV
jgi:SAM-dependent methyltransferase